MLWKITNLSNLAIQSWPFLNVWSCIFRRMYLMQARSLFQNIHSDVIPLRFSWAAFSLVDLCRLNFVIDRVEQVLISPVPRQVHSARLPFQACLLTVTHDLGAWFWSDTFQSHILQWRFKLFLQFKLFLSSSSFSQPRMNRKIHWNSKNNLNCQ